MQPGRERRSAMRSASNAASWRAARDECIRYLGYCQLKDANHWSLVSKLARGTRLLRRAVGPDAEAPRGRAIDRRTLRQRTRTWRARGGRNENNKSDHSIHHPRHSRLHDVVDVVRLMQLLITGCGPGPLAVKPTDAPSPGGALYTRTCLWFGWRSAPHEERSRHGAAIHQTVGPTLGLRVRELIFDDTEPMAAR